ncbi:MAG TPA: trypsin-like peptidase domain-containing protein [Streptosporangiaceae bacterium]
MPDTNGYGPYGSDSPVGYGGPVGYGPGGYPPPPRGHRGGALSHLAVAVLAAAAGAGVTVAVYHPGPASPASAASAASSPPAASLPGAGAVPTPRATPAGTGAAAGGGGEQQVVNKVEPGLVIINTALQFNSETAAGTGMVINSDGLVLTNNHVIEDATKITATVVATGKTYPVTVVGYDTTRDIALIRLNAAADLRTVPLGDSAGAKSGEAVVALGNAEGQGTILPAVGRITGLGKTIQASDEGGSAASETLHGMIETDAGIVSGDSGGPLANSNGQVIGMDTANETASFTQQQTAGFAIPINAALSVARQIAAGDASSTISIGYPPFIGIFYTSASSSNPQVQAEAAGGGSSFGGFGGFGGAAPSCYQSNANVQVPASIAPVNSGTLVEGTVCGSPAARAGITGGSVITAVDGRTIGRPASLGTALAGLRPGQTISVGWVSPSGEHNTSQLRLTAGPPA